MVGRLLACSPWCRDALRQGGYVQNLPRRVKSQVARISHIGQHPRLLEVPSKGHSVYQVARQAHAKDDAPPTGLYWLHSQLKVHTVHRPQSGGQNWNFAQKKFFQDGRPAVSTSCCYSGEDTTQVRLPGHVPCLVTSTTWDHRRCRSHCFAHLCCAE